MKILYLFVKKYTKPKRFNQEGIMRFHKLMMNVYDDAKRKQFEHLIEYINDLVRIIYFRLLLVANECFCFRIQIERFDLYEKNKNREFQQNQ